MDIAAICDGLKNVLEPLNAQSYARVPASANTPCLVVYPKMPFVIQDLFGGGSNVQFSVWCLLDTNEIVGQQDVMFDWMSTGTPGSISDLIEANTSLDGSVSSAEATEWVVYGIQPWLNGAAYFQAELTLDILTS